MNEITLHRGASPHLIYLDAEVNGEHLTEVVADGCLLSTPTGSTACKPVICGTARLSVVADPSFPSHFL